MSEQPEKADDLVRYTGTLEFDLDIEISAEHLAMVMSEEWAKSYYTFASENQAIKYLVRLELLYGPVHARDGHANMKRDLVYVDDTDCRLYFLSKVEGAAA